MVDLVVDYSESTGKQHLAQMHSGREEITQSPADMRFQAQWLTSYLLQPAMQGCVQWLTSRSVYSG